MAQTMQLLPLSPRLEQKVPAPTVRVFYILVPAAELALESTLAMLVKQ
jgi:hypothetical protein